MEGNNSIKTNKYFIRRKEHKNVKNVHAEQTQV